MSNAFPELPEVCNVKSALNKKLRAAKGGKPTVDTPLSHVPSTPREKIKRVVPDLVTKPVEPVKVVTRFKKPKAQKKASKVRAIPVTPKVAKAVERKLAAEKALDNVVKSMNGLKLDVKAGKLEIVKPGKKVVKKADGRGTKPKLAKEPKAKVAKTKATKPVKIVEGFGGKKGKLFHALTTRKNGVTMPELLKICGWKRCRATIGKLAKATGRKLVNNEGHYSII